MSWDAFSEDSTSFLRMCNLTDFLEENCFVVFVWMS